MAPAQRTSLIAAGHEQVAAAAAEVLAGGGNAFDAAVAAGFAAAVAEPTLTSLGGGGFLLARTAGGEEVLFDFFVDTPGRGLDGAAPPRFESVTVRFPGADQLFRFGAASAAVPGCLRGYLHIQRRLGRAPLESVLAPAVALARSGAQLDPFHAETMVMLAPIMSASAESRRLFAPQGALLAAGERLFNPELADLLETLPSEGDTAFYRGEIAAQMVADSREAGGLLTRADLAEYRVIERPPLEMAFRGVRLLGNPPPSFGGALVAFALERLERRRLGAFGSADHLQALAETLAEMEARHADTLAERPHSSRGTTHVSVIDAEGNIAAMTTSNGEGSGYIVPGCGVMLNNMLGEDDLHPGGVEHAAAGVRVASMMAPTLALAGKRPFALGSGGSKRIRSAVAQVLLALLAFELPLAEAVAAPRLHLGDDRFEIEPGFDDHALEVLARRWTLNRWQSPNMYFGGVHAVRVPGEAVGDARRGGHGRQV